MSSTGITDIKKSWDPGHKAVVGQQIANFKQDNPEDRKHSADMRHLATDSIPQTMETRQHIASFRQETPEDRKHTTDKRHLATDSILQRIDTRRQVSTSDKRPLKIESILLTKDT